MNYLTYLHLFEKNTQSQLESGVIEVIQNIEMGPYLDSSKTLRKLITGDLHVRGWSSKVKLSANSNISITAMNGKVALCLQTGNMGRFYSDLLKLQYLFQKQRINSAIYILPTKYLAKKMGSNLANFERLVSELKLFQEVITIPILIIGLQ